MSSLPPLINTEDELIADLRSYQARLPGAGEDLTDEGRALAPRWRQHLSNMGQTRLAALSDVEIMIVYFQCELTGKIHQEISEGAAIVRQLRDHLEYLRYQSNCPPSVIGKIQGEILKLTLI